MELFDMVAEQACPDGISGFFFSTRREVDGLAAAKTTGAAQPVKVVSQDEPGPYGIFINSHHGQISCSPGLSSISQYLPGSGIVNDENAGILNVEDMPRK